MFSTGFTSVSVLLHFPLLVAFLDSVSYNTDEVLSINPTANVFIFGDFNVHHKDWLTYSGGTDRSGELCYNLSISNNLTQMVNLPSWIPGCDSDCSVPLDFFLSSDSIICSTMAFPAFGNLFILLSQFLLSFHDIRNGMLCFITKESKETWLLGLLVNCQ